MSYATASELRQRYTVAGVDEFVGRNDEDLEAALLSASQEIASHLPAGEQLAEEATAILKDKAMTLARMLAYPNQALDEVHPIVREGRAVRAWLLRLAKGTAHLPVVTGTVSARAPVAPTRTMAMTDEHLGKMPS